MGYPEGDQGGGEPSEGPWGSPRRENSRGENLEGHRGGRTQGGDSKWVHIRGTQGAGTQKGNNVGQPRGGTQRGKLRGEPIREPGGGESSERQNPRDVHRTTQTHHHTSPHTPDQTGLCPPHLVLAMHRLCQICFNTLVARVLFQTERCGGLHLLPRLIINNK